MKYRKKHAIVGEVKEIEVQEAEIENKWNKTQKKNEQ
jgi:predicted transcriptional regulator